MTGTNADAEDHPDEGDFSPVGPRDWAAGDEPAPADDDEDGFVPPDPGPVLGGDPLVTMAWAAVIAVPIVLVAASVMSYPLPTALTALLGVAFAAGAGMLIWRLPSHRGDDDETGAVV